MWYLRYVYERCTFVVHACALSEVKIFKAGTDTNTNIGYFN